MQINIAIVITIHIEGKAVALAGWTHLHLVDAGTTVAQAGGCWRDCGAVFRSTTSNPFLVWRV